MNAVFKIIPISLALVISLAATTNASADTISVTQIITVTATVAPARSIVVNEQGQMTKIYSNTNQSVAPQVYLNSVPGESRPLTPELLAKYTSVISQQKNLDGVEIPVTSQVAHDGNIMGMLLKSVSSLTRPMSL